MPSPVSKADFPAARAAEWLERHPGRLWAFLTAIYILLLIPVNDRLLWHDELYTFYIATAPSWSAFVRDVRNLDLNPPLIYFITRASDLVFGANAFATRLPSMLEFYAASVLVFVFLRGRMGALWSAIAILFFWSGGFFVYSAEARPYAQILFFFAALLVSYDLSISRERGRGWALAGIFCGGIGVFLSHVFAPIWVGVFYGVEGLRTIRRRRIDIPVWICLLLPIGSMAYYLTLVQRFETNLFPSQFQGSPYMFAHFYYLIVRLSFFTLLAALAGAYLAVRRTAPGACPAQWRWTDAPLALFLVLAPAPIVFALMRSHGAFWDRYCIVSGLAVLVCFAAALAWRFRGSRAAALGAIALMAPALLATRFAIPMWRLRGVAPRAAVALDYVEPDLPLVSANGPTFLEMDHYEPPEFQARLYYLSDRAAATQYAHATLFEGFAGLRRYFPIQSHTEPLVDFLSRHRHFVVIGRANFAENWLMPKLRDGGAAITHLGYYKIPYNDRDLWDVTMPTRPVSTGEE